MSHDGSGRWIWYRSMWSVPRRRQRVLALLDQPAAGVALRVAVVGHAPWALVASTTLSRLPARALPTISSDSPRGVDVGGVDEVDAGVERGVDDGDALVVVRVAERAEHHGAEAERADLDAGAPERAVLHRVLPVPRRPSGRPYPGWHRSKRAEWGGGVLGEGSRSPPSSLGQPTEPSICSSIRRLHSTAYSIGQGPGDRLDEPVDDHAHRLLLGEPAAHQVEELVGSDLGHGRLMADLGVALLDLHVRLGLGDRVLVEDQRVAAHEALGPLGRRDRRGRGRGRCCGRRPWRSTWR